MQSKQKTLRLTQLSLLIAIEVLLSFTPLGFIPLPIVSVTTLHVPVIIGAILLGPIDGAILGGVMGVCSMVKATYQGTAALSYLISPFSSGNPVGSIIMALVSRIMIGIVAGYAFEYLKSKIPTTLAIGISAFLGTITNTILFLGFMWLFFRTVPLVELLGMIVGINTLLEIIVAVLISIAVCIPVMRYLRRKIVV